jgi:hypothetical protein
MPQRMSAPEALSARSCNPQCSGVSITSERHNEEPAIAHITRPSGHGGHGVHLCNMTHQYPTSSQPSCRPAPMLSTGACRRAATENTPACARHAAPMTRNGSMYPKPAPPRPVCGGRSGQIFCGALSSFPASSCYSERDVRPGGRWIIVGLTAAECCTSPGSRYHSHRNQHCRLQAARS